MRSIRDLLAEHPTFAGLPAGELDLIAGCGRNVRLPAGSTLFQEGEPADAFYVLRAGRVALEVHAPGRAALVVGTVDAGDVLGWSWLFPPYHWDCDATVTEDVSAVVLDGACLRGKCDEDHHLGYRLMQRFASIAYQRLRDTRYQLLDLYGQPGGSGA